MEFYFHHIFLRFWKYAFSKRCKLINKAYVNTRLYFRTQTFLDVNKGYENLISENPVFWAKIEILNEDYCQGFDLGQIIIIWLKIWKNVLINIVMIELEKSL